MSKRLTPYRKIPPPNFKETLRTLPKFYLIGITGPTSFIITDLKNYKYKITIGNELKCSCCANLLDHCIHTLFIMSEVFYIEQNDPILWQTSYLNEQLRYMIANRRIKLNKITQFLKYVKSGKNKFRRIIEQQSDEDDDDNLCAICQQQMIKTDMVTSCSNVCKNSFHLQCFKQWGEHQLRIGKKVTCPLCRDQKNESYIIDLILKQSEQKHQKLNKKIGLTYSYFCQGCNLREIQEDNNVYKCLVCQDIILCSGCFTYGKHIRHSFIVKKSGSKKWTYTQDRKNKKKHDQSQNLIRIKITEPKFYNFLAATLPCYFSKNTRWNILQCKRLDIKLEWLQCIMCDDKQKAFLRRLYCGHFVHHKCLKKRIQKHKFFCKIDGQKYLLGYQALIKTQKLNKYIEDSPKLTENKKQEIQLELSEFEDQQKKLKTQNNQSHSVSKSKSKFRNLSISQKKSNIDIMNRSFNPQ